MQYSLILNFNTVKKDDNDSEEFFESAPDQLDLFFYTVVFLSIYSCHQNIRLYLPLVCAALFIFRPALFNGMTTDEQSPPDTSPSNPASILRPSLGAVSSCSSPSTRQETPPWNVPQWEEVWARLGTPLSPLQGSLLGGCCLIKLVQRLRMWETSAVQRGQKLSSYPSAKLFITSPSKEVWEKCLLSYIILSLSSSLSLSLSLSVSFLPYPYFMKSSGGMKLSETNPLLDI